MRKMAPAISRSIVAVVVLAAVAAAQESRRAGGTAPPDSVRAKPDSAVAQPDGGTEIAAGGAALRVDLVSGRVTSIRLGPSGEEMCQSHPAGGDKPSAFIEVLDLRDGRAYNPLFVKSAIRLEEASGGLVGEEKPRRAGAAVRFTQQYEGAPFSLTHTLRPTTSGVRWEAAVRLAEGQTENRSVQVTWAIPLPYGWSLWGPNDTISRKNDGVTPMRFVYGHTDASPYGLVIPLVGVWGKSGGAAIYSPPDVRKCQIMFDMPSQTVADMAKGVWRTAGDLPMLRVTHHLVGLRPGKTLTLAVQIASTRPDWRGVMGHYAAAYPELFEPVAAARAWEGMYSGIQAGRYDERNLESLKARRATCVEVHAHFPEYGEYIPPAALKNPDLTWFCRPHPVRPGRGLAASGPSPTGELSLKRNREIVDQLGQAGIGAFIYYYNVHAGNDLVKDRFAADLMLGETGQPNIQYQGEPALRARADSPFGKQLLEQLGLLLEAYPKAPGLFVDNFSIQWLDFAHDDGVSMVHHRAAYDLNRNHQELAPVLFEKAHAAGKVLMVNKLATIESARGVDMVLLEGMDLDLLKFNALACAYRAVFPTAAFGRRTETGLEGRLETRMQQLLVWGGTPADYLKEYRPLTDALIGKRWVFDAEPLDLPAGCEGQIFRIDPHAPRAGDVVVSLVRTGSSFRDGKFVHGLAVAVNVPEADQLKTATFLAVEKSDQPPQPCALERAGMKLTIRLPPVGAAGIVRLTR